MRGKQINFFSLLVDMDPILRKIEKTIDINYFRMGMFENQDIPLYQSIFEAPNLGTTLSGDWNRIDRYLVMPKGIALNVQGYPQKAGGIRYAVDQSMNADTVEFKLGGIYKESGNVLVAGRVATISETETSLKLWKLFSSSIRKEFKSIGGFYVGKGAEEKLRSGWRLVTNDKSPVEYDLSINQ